MKPDDNAILRRLGRTLRALRALRGLTQAELATRCEISQNHLSNIETGNRELGVVLIARIARALRVPPNMLLVAAFESRIDTAPEPTDVLASNLGGVLTSTLDDMIAEGIE